MRPEVYSALFPNHIYSITQVIVFSFPGANRRVNTRSVPSTATASFLGSPLLQCRHGQALSP